MSLVRTSIGLEKMFGDEARHRLAQFIFAPGDDRRVRYRQAQRMPEQRHHREPVGQRADHAGLGKGMQPAGPRLRPAQGPGEQGGHQQQQ